MGGGDCFVGDGGGVVCVLYILRREREREREKRIKGKRKKHNV